MRAFWYRNNRLTKFDSQLTVNCLNTIVLTRTSKWKHDCTFNNFAQNKNKKFYTASKVSKVRLLGKCTESRSLAYAISIKIKRSHLRLVMYVLSHIRCFEYFRTFSFVIQVPWSTKDESRAQLDKKRTQNKQSDWKRFLCSKRECWLLPPLVLKFANFTKRANFSTGYE